MPQHLLVLCLVACHCHQPRCCVLNPVLFLLPVVKPVLPLQGVGVVRMMYQKKTLLPPFRLCWTLLQPSRLVISIIIFIFMDELLSPSSIVPPAVMTVMTTRRPVAIATTALQVLRLLLPTCRAFCHQLLPMAPQTTTSKPIMLPHLLLRFTMQLKLLRVSSSMSPFPTRRANAKTPTASSSTAPAFHLGRCAIPRIVSARIAKTRTPSMVQMATEPRPWVAFCNDDLMPLIKHDPKRRLEPVVPARKPSKCTVFVSKKHDYYACVHFSKSNNVQSHTTILSFSLFVFFS